MYRLIYALLWPLGAKWLLRCHANAQIWSDFSELFDSTPELKMSVHVFQRSDGFLGHSMVLFSILSVTDCFCFRSPLTHSCTDTYNLHTVWHTATHSRPLSCAPAMTRCCFCFNGYLISVLSVSASVRPLSLPVSLQKVTVHISLHAVTARPLREKLCPLLIQPRLFVVAPLKIFTKHSKDNGERWRGWTLLKRGLVWRDLSVDLRSIFTRRVKVRGSADSWNAHPAAFVLDLCMWITCC